MWIVIRKAKREDVSELKKIDEFGEQLNRYSGLDKLEKPSFKPKKRKKSYYEIFIYGRKKWCYVAEKNKKIIGFILFNLEKRAPYFKIKRIGYIDLLFVHKKARRKGVSKLLMSKAYEIFKKEKVKYLKLSVHTDNPSHQIWKKQGFRDYRTDMFKKI